MPTTTTGLATSFINFSRPGASGGGATVTDADGKIKWAGHNLLTNSESFDAAAWSKTHTTSAAPVVTANAGVAPDGKTTADRADMGAIDASGDYSQLAQSATTAAGTYTGAVWVKAVAAGDVGKKIWLYLYDTTERGIVSVTLTDSWQIVTTSFALSGAASFAMAIATLGSSFSGGANQGAVSVYLWGAHLYRSDLGGMQQNPAMGAGMGSYYPTTPRNLVGYSEDFNSWTKSGTTVTSNTVIAPNGLQTADTVNVTGGAAAAVLQIMPSTSGLYTSSIYAKAGTKSVIQFSANASAWGVDARANFNLATGALGTVDASLTAAITPIGDGWYRCSVLRTKSATAGALIWCVVDDATAAREAAATAGTLHVWGAQLSDSASLDTYVPQYGAAVTSAAYYAPRLDFDPVTLAAKGLLVEELRVNVLQQTAALENAAWTKVSSDAATKVASPDGTSSANLVYPTSSTTFVGVRQIIAAGGFTSGVYTISVYAKAAGKNVLGIIDFAGGTGVAAYFTLTGSGTATNGLAGYTQTITPLADGWYRCTMTSTSSWSNAGNLYTWIVVCDAVGSGAVTASGTNGIQMYGVQTELGSFATSYIPNGSATSGATRTADVASVSTQAFPYSASEGTLVANGSFIGGTSLGQGGRTLVTLQSDANNRLWIDNGFNSVRGYVLASGNEQANLTSSSAGDNVVLKAGLAFAANNFAFSKDGAAVSTDTTGSVPSANEMRLGNLIGVNFLSGHIRQITYLPRRISNADLIARTA